MEFKVQFKHENKNRYIYNCGHKFTVSENTMIESMKEKQKKLHK